VAGIQAQSTIGYKCDLIFLSGQ